MPRSCSIPVALKEKPFDEARKKQSAERALPEEDRRIEELLGTKPHEAIKDQYLAHIPEEALGRLTAVF